jgi:hypothetical protein
LGTLAVGITAFDREGKTPLGPSFPWTSPPGIYTGAFGFSEDVLMEMIYWKLKAQIPTAKISKGTA